MRKVSVWDVLFWIVMVAIIASLVRPGSKAGTAVVDLMDAFAAVVGETTGYYEKGS